MHTFTVAVHLEFVLVLLQRMIEDMILLALLSILLFEQLPNDLDLIVQYFLMFQHHIHEAKLFDLQFETISICVANDLFGEGFIQLLHTRDESLLQSFIGFAVGVRLVDVAVQEKGKVLVVK